MSLNLVDLLREYAVKSYIMKPNRLVIEIEAGKLREVFTKLTEVLGKEAFYLATIEGTDLPEKNLIRVDYFINVFKHNAYLVLRTYLPRENPVIPSVTDLIPGALAGELETYDLLGVLFNGNNHLRRSFFVSEDISSKGIYPLRKDSGV
ncbi:MAG: NADH-quinone oxidoreductase subunit C [Thermoprotei archaeon]